MSIIMNGVPLLIIAIFIIIGIKIIHNSRITATKEEQELSQYRKLETTKEKYSELQEEKFLEETFYDLHPEYRSGFVSELSGFRLGFTLIIIGVVLGGLAWDALKIMLVNGQIKGW